MSQLSFSGGGNFATARRTTMDSYSVKKAGEMLGRSPGAYQSVSLATGVCVERLKKLFPEIRRPFVHQPLARVIPAECVEGPVSERPAPGERTTVGEVIDAVCRHYGLTRTELLSEGRSARVARPRQIAMWLCRKLTVASFPSIAKRLGNRDHSTIHHGFKCIESQRHDDDALQADLDQLSARLLSDCRSIDTAIATRLVEIEELYELKRERMLAAERLAA